MIASIIIPVAPFHTELAQRAVASAKAQTVTVEVIVVEDKQKRGAGWARNQGIQQASAPFLVFLDADDELHESFVEKCVVHWKNRQPSLIYPYTDWYVPGGEIRYSNGGNFFEMGMFHTITTLVPTKAVQYVGGFDETLPVLEDEDLYMKLATIGYCAERIPEPLLTYHYGDGYSASNPTHQDQALIRQVHRLFYERYGRFRDVCQCKDPVISNSQAPIGSQGDDFVIALANYTPGQKIGPVTKRKYPRAGLMQAMWVHRLDAEARPDWWIIKADPASIRPDYSMVEELVANAQS